MPRLLDCGNSYVFGLLAKSRFEITALENGSHFLLTLNAICSTNSSHSWIHITITWGTFKKNWCYNEEQLNQNLCRKTLEFCIFLSSPHNASVPNLQDLMPDDLRWSWYNNNKVHSICNLLESFWNHPVHPIWEKNCIPWNNPCCWKDWGPLI